MEDTSLILIIPTFFGVMIAIIIVAFICWCIFSTHISEVNGINEYVNSFVTFLIIVNISFLIFSISEKKIYQKYLDNKSDPAFNYEENGWRCTKTEDIAKYISVVGYNIDNKTAGCNHNGQIDHLHINDIKVRSDIQKPYVMKQKKTYKYHCLAYFLFETVKETQYSYVLYLPTDDYQDEINDYEIIQ